jgi:hypothetical protein
MPARSRALVEYLQSSEATYAEKRVTQEGMAFVFAMSAMRPSFVAAHSLVWLEQVFYERDSLKSLYSSVRLVDE